MVTAEPMAGGELRRRAAGGARLLGARGALVLVLGVGANIVLARLLAPRDFGIVALGSVFIVLGGYLADGGLGAALLRRPEPPARSELEAVNGVQVAATAALALAIAVGSIPFGRDGLVVATMVATLPITIVRTPSTVLLERQLRYRVIALSDVIEAISFYAWALTTVALGMGVWGMATGMVVRAVAGTAVMIAMGPAGLVRPRWSWSEVRPLVGFGARVQAVVVVAIVREQGLNLAVAAIAGISTLGVWNLAWRVLQVPFTLFGAVGRIAYPAMSRLLAAGEDPRPVIERGLATVAVATALVLVAVVGFAPSLPALVGEAWADVPETLLWSSLAMLVGGPAYVVIVGYLYAAGDVGTVLRAVLVQTAAWFALTLPSLPSLGPAAIGLGWVLGAALNVAILTRGTLQGTRAAVAASLAAPTVIAILAGAVGWLTATAGPATVLHGVLGAAAGEAVLLGGLLQIGRASCRERVSCIV
jgi:O-antigen/teichoic acid export membrane protein